MTKSNSILKEAIAEAKAVRETALANAMASLQESFRPQLTSMLTKKLRNESESVAEQKKLDSSGIGGGSVTVDDPGPKKPSAGSSSSSDIDNPEQEIETFGEGVVEEHDGAPEFGHDGDENDGDEDDGVELDINPEHHGKPGEEGSEGDDNLDLEAIVRELEQDLAGSAHGEHGEEFGRHNDSGEPIEQEGYDDPMAGKFGQSAKYAHGHDDENDVGDEMHEEADGMVYKDSVKGDKSVDGVPGGTKVADLDEEIDLEEILREMEADDEYADGDVKLGTESKIASENVQLKQQLREHRQVIQFLRDRINEVNMLNSKLMYTTKVIRNFDLTESQKRQVVAQFDRAKNIREAKIIFTTLVESLSAKSSSSSKKTISKITEGASKTVASTKPKSQVVITEGDTQVARFQKLAGIQLNS